MLKALADVGTRYGRVEDALSTLGSLEITNKTALSEVENVDIAKAIVDLQMQEVAYQAALLAVRGNDADLVTRLKYDLAHTPRFDDPTRELGSYRAAARACGVDHNTVKAVVERVDGGLHRGLEVGEVDHPTGALPDGPVDRHPHAEAVPVQAGALVALGHVRQRVGRLEAELLDRFGEVARRRFAGASGRPRVVITQAA